MRDSLGVPDWITDNKELLGWIFSISLVTLIVAAIAVPVVISRMSADYFMPDRDLGKALVRQHPILRWSGLILKNLFGFILFIAGIAMLFTPGQGLLTMFIGLMLMDFPGKRRLELWMVRRPAIHKSFDWIRSKAGRKPLLLPTDN